MPIGWSVGPLETVGRECLSYHFFTRLRKSSSSSLFADGIGSVRRCLGCAQHDNDTGHFSKGATVVIITCSLAQKFSGPRLK